ncbi:MMPL family transporter [Clavibacter zhangzhiyongii]|uniref:MMPL family transporter n=1 Tax=Clavibacter zhangzhiyongii TaxID=2768071 RepID=UPI0039E0A2BF
MKESAQAASDAGLTVSFGGQVFQDVHYGVTVTEAFGVLFAGLVLVITFGSMLAAGLPLIGALVGVAASSGALLAAARFVTVSSASPLLAVMIGLAVGIDYALFILMRHRTQLANGMPVERSAATAVATAGSAVIFAGVTVIIALLGLLVVQIPFLTVMGLGAAFAVLLAMGVATTLLPAMLGFAGERLRPKEGSRAARRATAQAAGTQRTLGARWVAIVTKVPIIPVVIVIGIAGLLAVPASQLQLGLPSGATEPAGSTSRVAYDTVSDAFGPGHNGPLVVLVDITQTTDPIGVLGEIGDEIRGPRRRGVRRHRHAEPVGRHRDHPGRARQRARVGGDDGAHAVDPRPRARAPRPLRHARLGHRARPPCRTTSRSGSTRRSCRSASSWWASRSSC